MPALKLSLKRNMLKRPGLKLNKKGNKLKRPWLKLSKKSGAEKAMIEAKLMKTEAEEALAKALLAKAKLEEAHVRSKANKCVHCEFSYDSLPELTDHINEAHNYPCSICSWECMTHKELQRHWTRGEVTHEFFCEFCGLRLIHVHTFSSTLTQNTKGTNSNVTTIPFLSKNSTDLYCLLE